VSFPESFKEIVGHEKVIERLKKIVSSKRIGHAYMFSGLIGTGKSLLVRAFAKAANCEAPLNGDACGTCPSCGTFADGSTLNYILVEPEDGKLSIDAVRELQRVLVYKVDKGLRFAVIEGADLMAGSASNVLLKTLEEPPAGHVIVLITSRGDYLLPTIQSRCQRMNTSPLPTEAVSAYLQKTRELGVKEAELIAHLSLGSISSALAIADDDALKKRNDFLRGFMEIISKGGKGFIDAAEKLAKDGELTDLLDALKSYLRDMAVIRAGASELVVNKGTEGLFNEACVSDLTALVECFNMAESARRSIVPPSYANKRLTMESLFIKCAQTVKN
jgi:DNA polymerase-3 subunit delta'